VKTDEVCGKTVDEATAITTAYGDRNFYFCSKTCEMNFARNPLRYVDKSHSASSTEGAPKINEDGEKVRSRS
jgi:YHS domain-containing protein